MLGQKTFDAEFHHPWADLCAPLIAPIARGMEKYPTVGRSPNEWCVRQEVRRVAGMGGHVDVACPFEPFFKNSHRVCKHGAGVAGPLSLELCLHRGEDEDVGGWKRGAGSRGLELWLGGTWVALWLSVRVPGCKSARVPAMQRARVPGGSSGRRLGPGAAESE